MANKPAPKKKWNDIQMAIAAVSMVTTLAAWNLFAGSERASALKRAQEQATLLPPTPSTEATMIPPTPTVVSSPTALVGKVYFGGVMPQTVIVVPQSVSQGGGNAGGGGGGGGSVKPPPSGGGTGGS